MPLPIYIYGTAGSATYSVSLSSFDAVMNTTPDNTINAITAKNIRDVNFTMFKIIEDNITPNLNQVTTTGNTTSNDIRIGGLRIDGLFSDKLGLTGSLGYILSATAGGVQWIVNSGGTTPTLQQVLTSGNTASSSYIMYGAGVFNSSNIFNGNSGTPWCAAFTKSIIINSTIQDISGSTGTSGYILSATAGGVYWIPNSGTTPNLHQVTNTGNTTSNRVQIGSLDVKGTASFNSIQLLGTLADKNGATGPSQYILQAKAGGVEWVINSGSTAKSLQETTTAGNTSSNDINLYRTDKIAISISPLNSTLLVGRDLLNSGSYSVGLISGANLAGSNYLNFYQGSTNIIRLHAASASAVHAIYLPNNSGTVSLVSNITLNQALLGGNTSTLGLQVGTASFGGTVSFSKGIRDNAGSSGAAGYVLGLNSANNIEWVPIVPYLTIGAPSASSYTLVLADNNKLLTMTNSSATTVTIPLNIFATGSKIDVAQYNSGSVTFAGAAGVTINSQYGYRTLAAQYVVASAIMTSTNVWLLIGNLIP
jgi:hypothetical protein